MAASAVFALAALLSILRPPRALDCFPWSTVVEDCRGNLLGARRAADGQWRFPPTGRLPDKFIVAATQFEDQRFYLHPGIDPLALARALGQDLRAGRIVSGGSTITMQLARMLHPGAPRTLWRKCAEAVDALRIEIRTRKRTVLAWYAALAPFGGNIVGLEAASYRYFGRSPGQLSWAEAATLAVLPNEPSLVHPGKNRDRLLIKRDMLLRRLHVRGYIDGLQLQLALDEPLIPLPHAFPDIAPHFVDRLNAAASQGAGARQTAHVRTPMRVRTTVDGDLQCRVSDVVMRHHRRLAGRGILNAGALVLDVDSGRVLCYVGNTGLPADTAQIAGGTVDMITAARSTGSVLKPLLYAAMLDAGELLPTTLIADIPTNIGGYAPQNYDREYQGAVPAALALARSLNIPAVRMVRQHGIERFHRQLRELGMSTITRPAGDYGISLILGGAEGTLEELTGIYASIARRVTAFPDQGCFFPPRWSMPAGKLTNKKPAKDPLSAGACWATLMAMQEVNRPGEESAWREFSSSRRVAWKTGTSFGFRDAWAIGCTPRYAVGVWAGNASGEGRAGLIGIEVAGPMLFDIINILPESGWFDKPEIELRKIPVCASSGYRPGPCCDAIDTAVAPEAGLRTGACPFHQVIHLDKSGMRVNGDCESVSVMESRSWFVLPPAMEFYYRQRHSDYAPLPPVRRDCGRPYDQSPIGLLYPHPGAKIYVPREVTGNRGRTIFQATHRDAQVVIHWHLDDQYLGSTQGIHQMAADPSPGPHVLVLVDGNGVRLERRFVVLDSGGGGN